MALPQQQLKIYRCTISAADDSPLEVQAVALVDQPAIERNFMAFKSQKPMAFTIDAPRQIISGPAMLADTPIYRRDVNNGVTDEYLVVFDKATIECIAQKFFAKGFNSNFNIMHDPAQTQDGVCIYQSFISDSSMGIAPMAGYEDAPEGSWFISAKVNNPDVWAKVVSGDVKGFSVEGVFSLVEAKVQMAKVAMTAAQRTEQLKAIFTEAESDEERVELLKAVLSDWEGV